MTQVPNASCATFLFLLHFDMTEQMHENIESTCYCLRNRKHTVFLSSYRNTSESLGEREMLWEHKLQESDSTAFLSSP